MLARNLDNLAVTEAMLEKYTLAGEYYAAALKIRDREDLTNLHSLALVYVAQDKPAEADPLYLRAIALLDAGDANPDLLKTYVDEYAKVLRELNRETDAVRLESRVKGKQVVPATKRAPVAAKQK